MRAYAPSLVCAKQIDAVDLVPAELRADGRNVERRPIDGGFGRKRDVKKRISCTDQLRRQVAAHVGQYRTLAIAAACSRAISRPNVTGGVVNHAIAGSAASIEMATSPILRLQPERRALAAGPAQTFAQCDCRTDGGMAGKRNFTIRRKDSQRGGCAPSARERNTVSERLSSRAIRLHRRIVERRIRKNSQRISLNWRSVNTSNSKYGESDMFR